ncbi:MAG TPA: class I SAM-dependent methyltransferase [Candidatus Bathyarchaeia archaeon]|nr:class I SAM-dependent methyltransferase [Candidatus Bathyarchaeia archaeon]
MNKKHWNTWAKRDWRYKTCRLKHIRDGEPYIEKFEPKLAPYLRNIKGKKVIVFQFGDGLVMLACAKKGATVTGVDFSSEQIRLARKAAEYCGVNVKLVEADCQNLPKTAPRNYFDLVVTECGIFCWIQNPETWMKNACEVLKKNGKLAVSDFHPISVISEEKDGKITFKKSYFDQCPEEYKPEKDVPTAVLFLWKLSDIINAAIRAGFQIEYVEEYYAEQEDKKVPILPTDFLLVAKKT